MRSREQRSRERTRRRVRRLGTVGGIAVVVLTVGPRPAAAQADDPPNATGDCSADATLSNGVTVDPYASSGVYEIPLSGSASYTGQVGDGSERSERSFSGQVVVLTPPGFPDIELTDAWTWSGTGTGQSDSGTVTWDLPSVLPRGVPFTVEGFHQDEGTRCEGSVNVKVEGGLFDSPLAPISLGGTALALAGVGFAMVPRRGGAV